MFAIEGINDIRGIGISAFVDMFTVPSIQDVRSIGISASFVDETEFLVPFVAADSVRTMPSSLPDF